ncbi:hypothetical protein MJG53_011814 [Ovis ammon polii x Ovis aries]|uniref:Uncharacterized protein n=1 Tax=Ovis ammon polii x Ovis aries TaxID=2918886 RepID=A0ACB9UPF5_9CETA|nr:hypothetical protein MJG53_011814 [Ovis ammon polii x Ovis aries]
MDGQILGQLRPLAEEEEEDGAALAPRPAFPGMGSEELRLASFYDWPLSAVVPPELLAAAGFFHTDVGGGQGWPAWSQCPAVQAVLRMGFRPGQVQGLLQRKYHQMALTGMSTSQLVADLLQEEDGGRVVGARAPALPGPELLTPRIEAQVESALESGPPGGEPGGVQDAEEQLRRLREERTCRVCLDRTVGVVFVPCGHLACAECAPNLQQCPICRAPVRSCVRTFLS